MSSNKSDGSFRCGGVPRHNCCKTLNVPSPKHLPTLREEGALRSLIGEGLRALAIMNVLLY